MTDNLNGPWEKVRRIWLIIDQLRGDPGCPWDRKQTPESVQTYLIEEAHEVAAAIRIGASGEVAEELGDLLFMVFFLIHLYEEQQSFRLDDVCDLISEKMTRRHPHVFGTTNVSTTEQVRDNWEKIKAAEKRSKDKINDGVPESLPALMRAYRILSRLSHNKSSHLNEVEHQAGEFLNMSQRLHSKLIQGESIPAEIISELLLNLVNTARLNGYRAEDILHELLRSI